MDPYVESLTGSIMWCIIFDENVGDDSISGVKIKDEFITDNIETTTRDHNLIVLENRRRQ